MKFKIKAGAEVDLLTKNEVEDALDKTFKKYYEAPQYMRIPWSSQGANVPVTIPGPKEGYIWSVKLVGCLFTVSAKLLLYVNNETDSNFVGFDGAATQHVLTYTSNTLVIKGGETLIVDSGGTATAAAGIVNVKQVSESKAHLL